ncbi:GmrSD restriction endonuclease domain-containing protein [Natrinema salaciae]|uniref:Uncharacterized conserved protein, contains ParB-like and HNH nuclease domains n=1 Tax=Natrinema salaciae TaxID=1186196 RepID=A0A1H9LUG9_9EURY|nr:DUF262 domain-containing protein [Natrinema salaciae]SER15070.1 Uncharacterized conserved protein, contains ParB-like and HNH nuclease domains [Natrinema salaciae]
MDGTPDDNFSLSSVFSQSYFEIPDYQRDYAWEKSNVDDLIDDVEFVYKQNNSSESSERLDHYFGTLVLEERGNIEPTDYEEFDNYGIVDGQQRLATVAIVISAIIDEMANIEKSRDVSTDFSKTIEKRREDIADKYVEYEGIERIRLGGLAKDAYDNVILDNTSPESYLEQDDLVEAERKIARAKATTLSRLAQWRESEYQNGSTDYAGYYKLLNNITQIITQRFEVNVKVVEDIDEAARMFKVINDRGRDLRLHDKIRSHLVYCASQSESLDSEDIYQRFNNIVRNITIHDGFSDVEVDDLVRIHWEVFASERSDSRSKRPGPSEIHRRLSDLDDFASVQRPNFESFISPYLNSLENFSELYPYLTNRDKFAERYFNPNKSHDSPINESVRKVQLLFLHAGSQSATTPILFATADKFGVQSPEFADMVSELEKLVFRYSMVMSHGAQGFANALSSIANDLYWSDVDPEQVAEVFNSESHRYIGYQSKELGIKDAIERIIEKRERIAPIEEVVSDFLDTPDVLDGSFTSGWGGVRSSEVVKYIMYEYERSLRGPSGLLSLAPYHEFRKNFQVEHLVPKNAEEGNRLEAHMENRNRIGNLAVLSNGENQSEGNSAFESKYNDIYSSSSLKVLRDLNGPDFTVGNVSMRNEELLDFINERWG